MKRQFFTLILVSFALMLVTAGCGKKVKKIDNVLLEKEFEHAPNWVLTEYKGEKFSAVGSARIGKGGIQQVWNTRMVGATKIHQHRSTIGSITNIVRFDIKMDNIMLV